MNYFHLNNCHNQLKKIAINFFRIHVPNIALTRPPPKRNLCFDRVLFMKKISYLDSGFLKKVINQVCESKPPYVQGYTCVFIILFFLIILCIVKSLCAKASNPYRPSPCPVNLTLAFCPLVVVTGLFGTWVVWIGTLTRMLDMNVGYSKNRGPMERSNLAFEYRGFFSMCCFLSQIFKELHFYDKSRFCWGRYPP